MSTSSSTPGSVTECSPPLSPDSRPIGNDSAFARYRWPGIFTSPTASTSALEAGELEIDNEMFERIVDVCGWPPGFLSRRGRVRREQQGRVKREGPTPSERDRGP
jgi:hypothetical protein